MDNKRPHIIKSIDYSKYEQPVIRDMVCLPDLFNTIEDPSDENVCLYEGVRSHKNNEPIRRHYIQFDSPPCFYIRSLTAFEYYHIEEFVANESMLSNFDSAAHRLLELFDSPIGNAAIINDVTKRYTEKAKNSSKEVLRTFRRHWIIATLGVEYIGTLNLHKENEWLQILVDSKGLLESWDNHESELCQFIAPRDYYFADKFLNEPNGLAHLSNSILAITQGGRTYIKKK